MKNVAFQSATELVGATRGRRIRSRELLMLYDAIVAPPAYLKTAWNIQLPSVRKERLQDVEIALWLDDPYFFRDLSDGQ
jgi:hypothetical protein